MIKRRSFGINLDEGVPLQSSWEFENLYVPCHPEAYTTLVSWLKCGEEPLLVGGQIGCGKSTLIEKAFLETNIQPDITLHFDQEGNNLSLGEFLRIIVSGFCNHALKTGIDLATYSFPKDFAKSPQNNWKKFLEKLSSQYVSLNSYRKTLEICNSLAGQVGYVLEIVEQIALSTQKKIQRPLLVFASGIDKYETKGAPYFQLKSAIAPLYSCKTLFEINAVHFFRGPTRFNLCDKTFLCGTTKNSITTILSKRMGAYAEPIREELALLNDLSGGNPRQALRLLQHFDIARRNRKNSILDALSLAVRSTTRDFFAYGKKPEAEIMTFIKKNNRISGGILSSPVDQTTALSALYGNWFFITDYLSGDSWPCIINPLVKKAFTWKISPEEPEIKNLRRYAEEHGMSPEGLDLYLVPDEKANERGEELLFKVAFHPETEKPLDSNLVEILDAISAALLTKDRSDRVIIAYKDENVLEAARSYLFAKANSYEYQRCSHSVIEGGKGKSPLPNIFDALQKKTDIYSMQFQGKWEQEQLLSLDKLRDKLLQYQMLWWIEYDELLRYLQHWTQLRQLFEIFVLEDDLLGSLTTEEINGDLAFFNELVKDKESSEAIVVSNLKIVLEYLKDSKGQ
jgi:hypothetical protein